MSFLLGTRADGTPLEIPAAALLRHAVSLGASGSGKTVAMKALCEEAARAGVPVIALDPQGDLASLGIMADREKALAKGVPPAVYDDFAAKREVVVWTPASTDGVPIAVNPLRARFDGADAETVTKALSGQAEAIASLVGLASSKPAVAFLNVVLESIHRERRDVASFADLAKIIREPRVQKEAGDLASARLIDQIEQQLHAATVGARGLLFRLGAPIDIDLLLGRREGTPGKTRISVVYLNTLGSQEEKDFFVQMLVSALYQWMLKRPSADLQALFYIDEVAPYLPPVRKPACKEALQLLFKQARKFGIGCLVATQNPGDLDYKALSQVSSWNLGRILVKQDLKKVEKFFQALAPLNAAKIMKKLPALATGEFELLAPDAFEDVIEYKVRWLASEHRTLESSELEKVNSPELKRRLCGDVEEMKRAVAAQQRTARTEAAAEAGESGGPGGDAGKNLSVSPRIVPNTNLTAQAPTASLRPGAPAEPDAAAEPERPDVLDTVRAALEKSPRVLTKRELCEETGLTSARIERALDHLERDGLVWRYDDARAHKFSWHAHKLRPDLGLTGPVERFRTQVFESDARKIADDHLEGGFFGKKETVATTRFFYFPLVKVHFRAAKETGWIFKEKREGTENIYLHPRTCDIVHCTSRGIEFRPTSEDHPLDLVDLDNKGKLEPAQPGELDLREEDFARALSTDEVGQRAARKFPLEVLTVGYAFLPCWAFTIEKKEGAGRRTLIVDAVLGAEVAL